jgi:hypothetical protein
MAAACFADGFYRGAHAAAGATWDAGTVAFWDPVRGGASLVRGGPNYRMAHDGVRAAVRVR